VSERAQMSPAQRKLRDQETGIMVGVALIAFLIGYPLLANYLGSLLGMSCEATIAVFVILPMFVGFFALVRKIDG
jgi:uncharacterized membrane protein (DUF485 family)